MHDLHFVVLSFKTFSHYCYDVPCDFDIFYLIQYLILCYSYIPNDLFLLYFIQSVYTCMIVNFNVCRAPL